MIAAKTMGANVISPGRGTNYENEGGKQKAMTAVSKIRQPPEEM
jgi:hypothetical protein